jgi:hypothetical protein
VVLLVDEDSFFAGVAAGVLEPESFFGELAASVDFFFDSARESVR